MTKKLLFFSILLLSALLLFTICGCRSLQKELPSPENLRVEKRVIYWDAVEHATEYVVKINDSEYTVSECSFPVYTLTANGGSYQIEVMACADDGKYSNSVWVKINAEFEAAQLHAYDESGYEYTLLKDMSGYELSLGKNQNIIGSIVIPASFGDYPVKRIADYAFNSYTYPNYPNEFTENLCNIVTTGIILPECLESIGMYAFSYMVRLEEIVIPNSVTTIDFGAFSGCTHLKKITLPEGLKSIPERCFLNTALDEIVLPEALETIGRCAFQCEYRDKETYGYPIEHVYSKLSQIVIPNSVKRIEESAFSGRENLSSIVWSDAVEWLDLKAFDKTQWYNEQPDGFVMLGFFLYKYKGEIPEDVEINIPAEVKRIAGGAFQGQKKLCTVVIAEGIQFAGSNIFQGCKNLSKVILPKDLLQIPANCFAQTDALKAISLPETVTYIGIAAFAGSGLECIDIPSSVKEIDEKAFNNCTALTDIYLSSTLEKLDSQSFSGCKSLSRIFYEGTDAMFTKLLDLEAYHLSYYFSNASVYYYSEQAPTDRGNFWHYADGIPTIW